LDKSKKIKINKCENVSYRLRVRVRGNSEGENKKVKEKIN